MSLELANSIVAVISTALVASATGGVEVPSDSEG